MIMFLIVIIRIKSNFSTKIARDVERRQSRTLAITDDN